MVESISLQSDDASNHQASSSEATDARQTTKKASKGVPPVFVIVVCLVVLTPYFYLSFFTKSSRGPALQTSNRSVSLTQRLGHREQYIAGATQVIADDLRGKDSWRYRSGFEASQTALNSKELAINEFRFFSEAAKLIRSSDRLDAFYSWIISTNRIYKVRRNQFDDKVKIQKVILEWN